MRVESNLRKERRKRERSRITFSNHVYARCIVIDKRGQSRFVSNKIYSRNRCKSVARYRLSTRERERNTDSNDEVTSK